MAFWASEGMPPTPSHSCRSSCGRAAASVLATYARSADRGMIGTETIAELEACELKARILAYLDEFNREPVIHTWTYEIDTAA
jgi:hypothetical protein